MDAITRVLKPGTIVHGRYQLERELGAGGFGITYQAWDLKEQCIVAVKECMPVDVAERSGESLMVVAKKGQEKSYFRFRERFLEEAKLIYQFQSHPNITRVKHLFYENNTAYYVMEFIEGKDLEKWLKQSGVFTWEQLRPVIAQIAEVLSIVHKSGIIHCDISPDNIFLLKNGLVKLIDFGAARNVLNGPTSIVILKKGFAPVEQLAGRDRVGPWTDIYALAVTIYYMCTGIMPPSAIERVKKDEIKMPGELGMRLPSKSWEKALKKAMSLRPEHRYQTMEEFWQELNCGSLVERRISLRVVQGNFAGSTIYPVQEILFGKSKEDCQVVYPPESVGVGGRHLRFWYDGKFSMVMDMGSGFVTTLNGEKMLPGLVYFLKEGDMVAFGKHQILKAVWEEIN